LTRLPIRRFTFRLRRASRSIGVRPSLYALAAVLALALGPLLSRAVPERYLAVLTEEPLRNLLSILASSMLAVAIFSLGTMVSAFQAAAASATPRARPLLAEDRTAQTAIATFIGAFLFSVAGLVGLALGLFDPGGRLILFVLAVAMIGIVVTTLIRWLEALAGMGGVGEAVELVETATAGALTADARTPALGGAPADGRPPAGHPLRIDRFAFVQHVDAGALAAVAERLETELFLVVRAGDWVEPTLPVAILAAPVDEADEAELRAAFTLGRQRSFDVDPRFGLRVLGEIAARALSPAVNDPGTARDVAAAVTRLLGRWAAMRDREAELAYPRVRVPPLAPEAVITDGFDALARFGASDPDVAAAIQQGLGAVARQGDAAVEEAARRFALRARELADAALDARDRARLAAVAEAAFAPPHALQGSTPSR